MTIASSESLVVLCPKCAHPHHYVQIRFRGGVNDTGTWRITCGKCGTSFLLRVTNPAESRAEFQIQARFEEGSATPELTWASSITVHNIPRTNYAPAFNLASAPLFRCDRSGDNLEPLAIEALISEFTGVSGAYSTAEMYLAGKTASGGHFAVAQVPFRCPCGHPHTASFYTTFRVGVGPPKEREYLLADVTGADLEDRLEGVMSKSEVMDLLAKLIIRWTLTSERVIVASPFVGHQWEKAEAKHDRWDWLLEQLDPERATLITRPATLSAFKKLGDGDVTYDLLKSLGLENKIVSANVKKQDFHAKFFVGIGPKICEVLSGSANLVHGPSLENITFRKMRRSRCDERYLDPMNVKLPAVRAFLPQFVRLFKNGAGEWAAVTAVDWPFPAA